MRHHLTRSELSTARFAGLLCLAIIVFTFDPDGNTVELVAKDPSWIALSDA